ncbi:MAG: AIPR family protein [Chitinophagaceae bacterium]
MNITEKILNETFKKYKHKHEGFKQDYFAALFMAKKHEKDIDTILEYCVFGNNDYGIDSYYFDRDAKNLYLYQFKWSNNHELFKDSYKRLINYGIDRIFGNPLQDNLTNQCINHLKYKLEEYNEAINNVYIRFVFNGDVEKAEQSKVLQNLREDLESKKYIIDKSFNNRSIQFFIEYLSNETNAILQASKTKKTHKYNFDFVESGKIIATNGETFYLGFLPFYNLNMMFKEMNLRLFEKNIRAGLDADKAPNRAIKNTLKNIIIDEILEPEYFSFNHNGITLYVENIELNNGVATIIEPRVLNGAQSIVTLSRFLNDNAKNPCLEKNFDRVKKIKVLAKIITNCQPDFITSVTIANNKQNPVDSINLRANDEIQLEFEDKFRNELGIFYGRQENAFESLTDDDLEEMGIFELKEINIRKLAQTF